MGGADAQLAKFLAGEAVDLAAAMRDLRGADPALVARVVFRLSSQAHWLPYLCAELPVAARRAIAAADITGAHQLFLRLAAGARGLDVWRRALAALAQLADTALALDHPSRRARLEEIAADPDVLGIVQGVIANIANVADAPVEMLAVLAIDGGDVSLDALIPHLDALARRDVRLERLAQVRGIARRTPVLDALFAELDGALAERRRASPALALAASFGARDLAVFTCSFRLASLDDAHLQGHVSIDSRTEPWSTVWLATGATASTRFTDGGIIVDDLAHGWCPPHELPAWLAHLAQRLAIRWIDLAVVTNLTGDARAKLTAWLRPVTAPPESRPRRRR